MTSLNRRTFLRGTGVAIALPFLDAMLPPLRSADPKSPRRMVAICTTLGLHEPHFTPTKSGTTFELTPYLEPLKEFRSEFTVLSGLSHPEVDGGHATEVTFLTASPHPGMSGFRNTISLDQLMVEKLAPDTRFSSLAMTTGNTSTGMSISRNGVNVPADNRASVLFAKLFLDGTPQQMRESVQRLQDGQSIMDTLSDETKRLEKNLGNRDRNKLDEYLTAVREVEKRLVRGQEWVKKPKPKVAMKQPRDIASLADFVGRSKLMFDLAHLALETDSTRLITLQIRGVAQVPPIDGITADWHNLSHHGKDPEKIAQLKVIELKQMDLLREFLSKLQQSKENGSSLLNQTMVLFGSNLGNASSHDSKNLPMLLAGGGFRHGQHLAFDTQNNTALGKVYVAMLQRLGVETDQFATGRGRLPGLEMT